MGLLDVLNGMQNGPRGPSEPSASSGGGMSPMTMAILALLGYKALKHFTGTQPGTSPSAQPAPAPGGPGQQRLARSGGRELGRDRDGRGAAEQPSTVRLRTRRPR